MRLRVGWVFALALALQVGAVYALAPGYAYPLLLATSYALLLVGVLMNRASWGFRLLLLGIVMNLLVLAFNGWRMPVSPEALSRAGFPSEASLASGSVPESSKSVVLPRDATRLWFLADIFPVSTPVRVVLSAGDLVAVAGVAVFSLELAAHRLKRGPMRRFAKTV